MPSAMIAAMSPATRTTGMAADARAQRTAARNMTKTEFGPRASPSVRGGPSSLVSFAKIANMEASPGSRASRA